MTYPSPSGPAPEDRGATLDARQAEIFRALSKLDPVLAGLFEEAVRVSHDLGRPGRVISLSHGVREVSNGVARHLSGWGFPPIRRDEKKPGSKEEPEDPERHRKMLAQALGKSPDHPAVTIWFKLHGEFRATWHYWSPLPAAPNAAAAFQRFTDILWALLGPFFATVRDLDPLLATETPTPAQVQSLHVALARPAQRAQFFQKLRHPGWVEPMRAGGFFRQPPNAIEMDGKWSWDLWPEGDYLARMAAVAPADVERALLELPKDCTNPMVWLRAAEAALALPTDAAARVARVLAVPARDAPFGIIFADAVGNVAIYLAEQKDGSAFHLTRALLRVIQAKKSDESILRNPTGRRGLVGAMSSYSLGQLLPRLVPALETVDAKQTLELFCHLLAAMLEIEFDPTAAGEHDDQSTRWCHDLSATDPREDDDREVLAVALAGAAGRWAAREASSLAAVLAILRKQPWRVFRRVELHALAQSGHLLPAELDRVVSDADAVADDRPPPEYRILLERQFSKASPEAQARHIELVQRGPGTPADLLGRLTNVDESPVTEPDVERYIVRWQQKRLRRFGENLPAPLVALRDFLDAHPRVPKPTAEDVLMDDGGGMGRVFSWSGPGSPISAAEIATRTPEDLVEFLRTFQPIRDRWDAPTPAGLARALEEGVAAHPSLGQELAQRLQEGLPDHPTYIRAVLQGLAKAAENGQTLSWNVILRVIQWVAARERGEDASNSRFFEYADANWDEAKRASARLLFHAAQKNVLRPDDKDAAWRCIGAFFENPATWRGSPRSQDEPVENVDAALMLALNHLGGDVAQALVELALWTYRLDEKHFDPTPLRAGLDVILAQVGRESYGARTMLGRYLPWLLLIDHDGVLARADRLFAGGFTPPQVNAGWGGYITSQNFFFHPFQDLRRWYVLAAEALPENRTGGAEADRTWSPTRHLLSHLAWAWFGGLAAPGDPDGLIATAFARAPASDLGHLYWEIFRGWTDRQDTPSPDAVERLIALWAWRLEMLAGQADTPARTEELAALGWFALIPWLSDAQVLPLLVRTSELCRGRFRMEHSMWKRVAALVTLDPAAGFAIAARIIEGVLVSEYPFLNAEDVRPILRQALQAGSAETKQRARDTINKLGENNLGQFQDLLEEGEGRGKA